MATCLLGLGSNLGDRPANLAQALNWLAQQGVRIVRCSQHHATASIGGPAGQGEFLNAAAVVETSLGPAELLDLLLATEHRLGRVRGERWAARTIDLDLLFYDQRVQREALLEIPHPRLAVRRFVLAPAAEIAPDWEHPLFQRTLQELLTHLDTAPNIAAICSQGDAAQRLAGELTRSGSHQYVDRVPPVEKAESLAATRPTKAAPLWAITDQWTVGTRPAPKLALVLHEPDLATSRVSCDAWEQSLRAQPDCPWLCLDALPAATACATIEAALAGMGRR